MKPILRPLLPLLFLAVLVTPPTHAEEALATLVVRLRPVALTFPVESVVEAVQQAVVSSQVSGRLVEVLADGGDRVKKGELLARIDSREAAEQVQAARAQYLNAKADYERSLSLFKQKFVSQAAMDRAKAALDSAAAQQGAAAAGQSHGTILSPLTGLVARRHVEPGDMAMPGKPLFTVYDPAGMRVIASIPQYQLPRLKGGLKARVEFPEQSRWVETTGITLLPMADSATHVTQVRVNLPTDLQGVLPGSFARVHFILGEAEKLTVPATAVLRRGEVAAVYVRSPEGRLALRQLRLGEAVGQGEIEVLAGLKAGESVALDPVKAGIALKAAAGR